MRNERDASPDANLVPNPVDGIQLMVVPKQENR